MQYTIHEMDLSSAEGGGFPLNKMTVVRIPSVLIEKTMQCTINAKAGMLPKLPHGADEDHRHNPKAPKSYRAREVERMTRTPHTSQAQQEKRIPSVPSQFLRGVRVWVSLGNCLCCNHHIGRRSGH